MSCTGRLPFESLPRIPRSADRLRQAAAWAVCGTLKPSK